MFTVELDTLLMVRRLLHQAGYGTGETNHDGLHVLMGAEIREATQAADLAVDAARQASGAGCEPSKATEARLAAAAAGKHLAGLRRQFDSKLREDLCKISEEVRSLNKWTTPFSIIMKPFGLDGLSLVHGQKPDGSTWCTASYGGTECTGTAPATPDRPTPLIVLGNPTDQAVAARKQHAAVQLPVNTSAASQLRLYALGLSRGGGIYVFGSGAPLAGESRSAAPLELAMRTPVVSTGASPSNQAPVAPSPAAKLRAPAARRHPLAASPGSAPRGENHRLPQRHPVPHCSCGRGRAPEQGSAGAGQGQCGKQCQWREHRLPTGSEPRTGRWALERGRHSRRWHPASQAWHPNRDAAGGTGQL